MRNMSVIMGQEGRVAFVDKNSIVAIDRRCSKVEEFCVDVGLVEHFTEMCCIILDNGKTIKIKTRLTSAKIKKAIGFLDTLDALPLNEEDYEIAVKKEELTLKKRRALIMLQREDLCNERREELDKEVSDSIKELKKLKFLYERFE